MSGISTVPDKELAVDRAALHDLLVVYARGADRGNAELMRSAFHQDGYMQTGIIDGPIEDYARDMVARIRSHYRSMFHSISNEYFEIEGDRARGECYVIAHAVTIDEEAVRILAGGRYLDRFEKRAGVWKIAHRSYVQDWNVNSPAQLLASASGDGQPPRGGYFPDDPAVAFWADPE